MKPVIPSEPRGWLCIQTMAKPIRAYRQHVIVSTGLKLEYGLWRVSFCVYKTITYYQYETEDAIPLLHARELKFKLDRLSCCYTQALVIKAKLVSRFNVFGTHTEKIIV